MKIVALDPAAPYRAALQDPDVGLHQATLVVDRFHMHKLANAAIDDVRRRVQQQTLSHHGRCGNPLYGVRKLLLLGLNRTGFGRDSVQWFPTPAGSACWAA